MSDYLFDKQGDPDPDVERLEGLLAPHAYRGAAPRLPMPRARRSVVFAAALSAAAAALLVLLVAKPWRPGDPRDREHGGPPGSWAALVRDGAATRDGQPITGATRLPIGAWLETQSGRVQLAVADIGTVELAPGTRVRIVATGPLRHELQLARGALAATIDAPPRRFVVTTPRAVVTDLGCAFELSVDESGRGRLVVTAGRVALSSRGDAREIVVNAGARVDLSERGPEAPYVPTEPRQPAPAPAPMQPPAVAPRRARSRAPGAARSRAPGAARSRAAGTARAEGAAPRHARDGDQSARAHAHAPNGAAARAHAAGAQSGPWPPYRAQRAQGPRAIRRVSDAV